MALTQNEAAARPADVVQFTARVQGMSVDEIMYYRWSIREFNYPLYTFSVRIHAKAAICELYVILKVQWWWPHMRQIKIYSWERWTGGNVGKYECGSCVSFRALFGNVALKSFYCDANNIICFSEILEYISNKLPSRWHGCLWEP